MSRMVLLLMVVLGFAAASVDSVDGPAALIYPTIVLSQSIMEHSSKSDVVIQKAVEALDRLDPGETCDMHAAELLLERCGNIGPIRNDTAAPGASLQADKVKNTFAIQLAVCQLERAAISAPGICNDFLNKARVQISSGWTCRLWGSCAKSDQLAGFDAVSAQKCATALYRDTRSWTSYSNAHQSAHALCEVVQRHTEQRDVASMAKHVLENIASTSEISFKHAKEVQTTLASHMKALEALERRMTVIGDTINAKTSKMTSALQTEVSELGNSLAIFETSIHNQFAATQSNLALTHQMSLSTLANAHELNSYLEALNSTLGLTVTDAEALHMTHKSMLALGLDLHKMLQNAINDTILIRESSTIEALFRRASNLTAVEAFTMALILVIGGLGLGRIGMCIALGLCGAWWIVSRMIVCALFGKCI